MVKNLFHVILFRKTFHISRKIFRALPLSKAYSTYWFNMFDKEPRQDIMVLFGRRKIPPTWFFLQWTKFDCKCLTSEFGIY